MALSQVQIANLALDVIGTRSTIASLDEDSNEANAISRHWDNAVDCCLRSAHWNFARRQVALTLLQDGTQGQSVPLPWLYEYAYPSDCVLFRQLMPTMQVNPVTAVGIPAPVVAYGPTPRVLVGTDLDINGNSIEVILTNQPQAIGVYTFRNSNTAMWDALFVEELAAYLGSRVCLALTGDTGRMRLAFQQAQLFEAQARAQNGNEGGPTVMDTIPDWMRARGYNSDWAYPQGGMFSYGPQALTLIT